ncbi:MAG: hypothetical protein K0R28_100 [Paenibacillus sp.]|jgi:O-antigen ligase|nr:hypothetical protein [Paenibacillus sp.]
MNVYPLKRGVSYAKPQLLRKQLAEYVTIAFAYLLIVMYLSSADYYIEKNDWLPVNPILFDLGAAAMLSGFLIFRELLASRGAALGRLYSGTKDGALFYYVLSIVGLLFCFHPDAIVAVRNNGFLYVLELMFLIMFTTVGLLERLRGLIRAACVTALLVYVASIMLDLMFVGLFSNVEGRAAGFAENPNFGAYSIVLLLLLSVDWRSYNLLDGVLWIVAAGGTFATLSRGGIIIFLFIFAVYLYFVFVRGDVKHRSAKFAKIGLTFIIGGLVVYAGMSFLSGSDMFSTFTGKGRLDSFSNVISGDASSISADSRVSLVHEYMSLAMEAPILGHGTGFTDSLPIGPHNLYLMVWTDYGLAGVVALLAVTVNLLLCFIKQHNRAGIVFIIVFLMECLFHDDILLFKPFTLAIILLTVLGDDAVLRRTHKKGGMVHG